MLANRLANEQTKVSRGSPKETAGLGRAAQLAPVYRGPWKLQPSGPSWPQGPHSGCSQPLLSRLAVGGGGSEPLSGLLRARARAGAASMPLDLCWLPLNPRPSPSALWHCPALCRRWGSCAFAGTKGGAAEWAPGPERGQWRVAPRTPARLEVRRLLRTPSESSWAGLASVPQPHPASLLRLSSGSPPQEACLPGCLLTTLHRTPVLSHSCPASP